MNKQLQYILLPTDKASKLHINNTNKELFYSVLFADKCSLSQPQHLYILSDDEIVLSSNNIGYFIRSHSMTNNSDLIQNPLFISNYKYKKIIATTNPELLGKPFIDSSNYPNGEPIGIYGIPSIFQSDIEYIISLHNWKGKEEMEWYPSAITSSGTDIGEEGKDWEWKQRIKPKEVDVEKLAEDFCSNNGVKGGGIVFNAVKYGYNQALQSNANKKFSLEDMKAIAIEIADWKDGYVGKSDGRNLDAFVKEFIQSLTKQTPNAERYSLEDMRKAIRKAKEHNLVENLLPPVIIFELGEDEIIQSITKEQPKSDTVMVEYEGYNFRNADSTGKNVICDYRPKLKDGCIVIVRD